MTLDVIREAQRKQPNLNDIMTNYRNATESKPYEMENGILYKIFKNCKLLMIPSSLEETVLNYYHQHATSVHMSRDRLWSLLKTRFYWPSMYTNVKVHLQNCLICAQIKTRAPKHHGLLQPIHVQRPFELIGVDIVILRVSTGGFRYILVGIDYFTSWVEAAPMKTLTAEEVIRVFFQIIVSRHGCPERLISDSGVQFTSVLMKQLCSCFNIAKIESSPYHQQANGKVEKFIGFLKKALALVTPQDKLEKWHEMIDHCLLVYRISVSRVLNDNPFYLLYGRDSLLPQDLAFGLNFKSISRSIDHNNTTGNYQFELVKQLTRSYRELLSKRHEEQESYKAYYDQHQVAKNFNIGDEVLVLFDAPAKGPLVPRWEGPFQVIEKLDDVTYRVQNDEKIIAIHVQRIHLFQSIVRKYSANVNNYCFQEVHGDIFTSSTDTALAHCVSRDFKMTAGIALEFHRRLSSVDKLQEQKKEVGEHGKLQVVGTYFI